MCHLSQCIDIGTYLQLHIKQFTQGWRKIQTKISGGISNQEGIIYNFKVRTPYRVTVKCCIWQNYNYYIMITLLPNKARIMRQKIKFKRFKFVLKDIHVPYLGSGCSTHGICATC